MTLDKITLEKITLEKITWDRAGRVTEPGRYMYTFGWLTITSGDLEIWKHYPGAAFTLLAHRPPEDSASEEFHLGAFDISPDAQSLAHGAFAHSTFTDIGANEQRAH